MAITVYFAKNANILQTIFLCSPMKFMCCLQNLLYVDLLFIQSYVYAHRTDWLCIVNI